MTNPGTLFPASWFSGFEASRSSAPVREAAERPQAALHARPEYKGEAATRPDKDFKWFSNRLCRFHYCFLMFWEALSGPGER